MTLPAVLSPEAEADLDDAAAWHERQADGLGKELVTEVRNALVRVGDQPEGYPELRPGVRCGAGSAVFLRDILPGASGSSRSDRNLP